MGGKIGGFESGLVIDGAGVHSFGEFHNRDREGSVAVQDGGLNRGGAAILGEERRVEIEDAFWLKEIEEVGFDDDAEASENAVGIGVGGFEIADGGEVGGGAGVEEEVDVGLEGGKGEIGEGAVAEENDFRVTRVSHLGIIPCCL